MRALTLTQPLPAAVDLPDRSDQRAALEHLVRDWDWAERTVHYPARRVAGSWSSA